MILHCCEQGCKLPATFLIYTIRRSEMRGGVGVYSDEQHACAWHLGSLIEGPLSVRDRSDVYWEVVPWRNK